MRYWISKALYAVLRNEISNCLHLSYCFRQLLGVTFILCYKRQFFLSRAFKQPNSQLFSKVLKIFRLIECFITVMKICFFLYSMWIFYFFQIQNINNVLFRNAYCMTKNSEFLLLRMNKFFIDLFCSQE